MKTTETDRNQIRDSKVCLILSTKGRSSGGELGTSEVIGGESKICEEKLDWASESGKKPKLSGPLVINQIGGLGLSRFELMGQQRRAEVGQAGSLKDVNASG
ncbi:hypothetical protein V6N13_074815 [Hibiscus sabdariffa]|uniref:Uncharacterized protein n=1 Tax=Hibiscus sabdariffa TaxID=183260 RepID=A0ABR2U9Q3_9ROSI